MRLFNTDHSLNMVEFAKRMEYWTNYAKTGATKDVETALERLTILQKVLARELSR